MSTDPHGVEALAAGTDLAPAQQKQQLDDTVDQMKRNPQGDWRIGDIEGACKRVGLILTPPSRGTHYKVTSERLSGHLTIPFKRPIKPKYIRLFTALVEAHMAAEQRGQPNE